MRTTVASIYYSVSSVSIMKLPRGKRKYLCAVLLVVVSYAAVYWMINVYETRFPHGFGARLDYNINDVRMRMHANQNLKLMFQALDELNFSETNITETRKGHVRFNFSDSSTERQVVSCTDGTPKRQYSDGRLKRELFTAEGKAVELTETESHRNRAFRDIFLKGEWGNDTYDSVRSGPGSVYFRTRNVQATLDAVLENIKWNLNKSVLRVLDVPCGDFSWMHPFLSGREDVIYTGMDIVPELIGELNRAYKTERVNFVAGDVVTRVIDAYDLVFCRHMTQHLSDFDTVQVLNNFSQSKSKYLLITTYPSWKNTDLMYGRKFRFRAQNLEIPPYALSPPICQNSDGYNDVTALWRLPLEHIVNCVDPAVDKYRKDNSGRRYYTCSEE